jgi:hypothetical protein
MLFRRVLSILLVSCFMACIIPVGASGSDRFGEYLRNDFQNLGNALNVETFAYTAAILYGLFVFTHVDENVQRGVQARYTGWRRTYLNIANEFGEPLYVLPGSIDPL